MAINLSHTRKVGRLNTFIQIARENSLVLFYEFYDINRRHSFSDESRISLLYYFFFGRRFLFWSYVIGQFAFMSLRWGGLTTRSTALHLIQPSCQCSK